MQYRQSHRRSLAFFLNHHGRLTLFRSCSMRFFSIFFIFGEPEMQALINKDIALRNVNFKTTKLNEMTLL